MSTVGEDEILYTLKRVEELDPSSSHQFRKLSKLHEKLSEREQMLSLTGAAKLYRAYEAALEAVVLHSQYFASNLFLIIIYLYRAVNEALEKVDNLLLTRKTKGVVTSLPIIEQSPMDLEPVTEKGEPLPSLSPTMDDDDDNIPSMQIPPSTESDLVSGKIGEESDDSG